MTGASLTVAVFGAAGPTGKELVEQLLSRGYRVTAVTRRPDEFPLHAPGLTVAGADATNAAQVARALVGVDIVTSVLGTSFSRKPIHLYSDSARAILTGMAAHGVRRLIVTSSMAAADWRDPNTGWFERLVLERVLMGLGRTLYDDMRRMEAILRASDVEWTVMRPLGLASMAPPTTYAVARDHIAGRHTARRDLAAAISDQVDHREDLCAAVAVATTNRSQSLIGTIWREGIRPKLPLRRA